jgi:hypothetical protein
MPGVAAAERIHEWTARRGDMALAGRGWKAYIPSLIL